MRIPDAPEEKKRDGNAIDGVAERHAPVVEEAGVEQVGEKDDCGWDPPDSGGKRVNTLEGGGALKESDETAEHERVGARVEAVVVVQEGVACQGETDDSNDWLDEDDDDGDLTGFEAAFESWFTKSIEQKERPQEVKLFFDAEGPEVLQRPHRANSVVVKEKESADDIKPDDLQPAGPTEEQEKADIGIKGRQDAHGSAKVEAAQTDRATFLMLVQKEAGDEIAADDEEDEDAGIAIEDGHR